MPSGGIGRVLAAALLVGCCCAGGSAAEPATGAPDAVQRSLKVLNPAVCPAEPVCLLLTWRNPSDARVELRDYLIAAVMVQKEGEEAAEPVRWWVAPTSRQFIPPIPVKARQSYHKRLWVVIGRERKSYKAPAEFLFPEPGRYRIWPDGVDPAGAVVVTVEEPEAPEDQAARELWTIDVAKCFVGEFRSAKKAMPLVEKLMTEHPDSRFAAYATWVKAKFLEAEAHSRRELFEVARLYEIIVDRYPSAALQEEAFAGAAELYRAAEARPRARGVAEELAEAFPKGDQVETLRARYGEDFERLGPAPRRPTEKCDTPATLKLQGLERVPEGARECFKAYWQARAKGDYAEVKGTLARDFMADLGGRDEFLAYSWKPPAGTSCEVGITIRTAEMMNHYTRPEAMRGGVERTWHGTICLIEGSQSIKVRGGAAGPGDIPDAWWALCAYPGRRWKVVSEYHHSRRLAAARKTKDIWRSLGTEFVTWRISDGRAERFPYEEVKKALAPDREVVEKRTRWENKTIHMMGEKSERARIVGLVHLYVKNPSDPKKRPEHVQQYVAIFLALDENEELLLESVRVTDKPWSEE